MRAESDGGVVLETAPETMLAVVDCDEGQEDWATWCELIQGTAHRRDEWEREIQKEGIRIMRARWDEWRQKLIDEGIEAPKKLPTTYRYTDLIEYAPPSVRQHLRDEARGMGDRSGIPDILVLVPRGDYCGLAIEVKTPKGWSIPWQRQMQDDLRNLGWRVEVCRSADAMVAVCEEYFSGSDTK